MDDNSALGKIYSKFMNGLTSFESLMSSRQFDRQVRNVEKNKEKTQNKILAKTENLVFQVIQAGCKKKPF